MQDKPGKQSQIEPYFEHVTYRILIVSLSPCPFADSWSSSPNQAAKDLPDETLVMTDEEVVIEDSTEVVTEVDTTAEIDTHPQELVVVEEINPLKVGDASSRTCPRASAGRYDDYLHSLFLRFWFSNSWVWVWYGFWWSSFLPPVCGHLAIGIRIHGSLDPHSSMLRVSVYSQRKDMILGHDGIRIASAIWLLDVDSTPLLEATLPRYSTPVPLGDPVTFSRPFLSPQLFGGPTTAFGPFRRIDGSGLGLLEFPRNLGDDHGN